MEPSPWQDLGAGSQLRTYQRRAVAALVERLAAPGARACLVAPPGAGKTHCGLHVAAALEAPVEVRVPTTALVEQWRQRIAQIVVPLGPGAGPPPFHVCTYAASRPFAPGALVLLDEAHHLVAAWGRAVEKALDGTQRVLGLTGTPPHGSAGWDRFVGLVGLDPVSIDAPPLVRDGHLSPYQDLVWPVITEADDLPALTQALAALTAVEARVGPQLTVWADRKLRDDLWSLTEDRFRGREALLVALARLRLARGRELPADLPLDPELELPPTLQDRALALHAFARDDGPQGARAAGEGEGRGEDLVAAVRSALSAAGYKPGGKRLVLARDLAWKSLARSRVRLRGLLEILALEDAARSDWLRALVLTDRDAADDRLSARVTLRAVVTDPRTGHLDPVLVTGSAFWVDGDIWPRLEPRLPELPWTQVDGHYEVDVSKWETPQRVALATRLLTDGVTRCLIGTRHLLGEGWDCPAVNVLVDLTGIVTPVTVNQIRGRALRLDPADPSKVASIWDVVALAPGVPGGERMLERLRVRHEHTLGIDAEGRIRAGASRIDPALALPIPQVAAEQDAIRERVAARVADPTALAALWAVGEAYHDRRVWRIEGRPAREGRRAAEAPVEGTLVAIEPAAPLPAGPTSLALRRQQATERRERSRWWGGALVGVAATVGMALGPLGAAIGAGGAALVAAGWVGWTHRRAPPSLDRDLLLQALFDALSATDQIEGVLRLEAARAWLEGDPAHSERFAAAAAELLGPIRYPRYLLVEPAGRAWPVPTALGADRSLAGAFATAWAAQIGPCEVVFAQRGRGREILVAAWRAGGRDAVELVEAWE